MTALVAIIVMFSASNSGTSRLLVVESGSMSPAISTGSMIFVQTQEDYSVDEVLTFKASADDNALPTTHRLIEIVNSNEQTLFRTQGDANDAPDSELIPQDQVIGKVIFSIPYIGYLVSFVKTEIGFILLVIIPATIIIYSELLVIHKEAKRLIKERKRRKLTMKEKVVEAVGKEEIAIENWFKRMLKKVRLYKTKL